MPCARQRLERALKVTVGADGETVVDRVMFGTDWLMLSQVKGWPDYPRLLLESVRAIATPSDVDNIFGLNAQKCFRLPARTA